MGVNPRSAATSTSSTATTSSSGQVVETTTNNGQQGAAVAVAGQREGSHTLSQSQQQQQQQQMMMMNSQGGNRVGGGGPRLQAPRNSSDTLGLGQIVHEFRVRFQGASDSLYRGEYFVLQFRVFGGYPMESPEVTFVPGPNEYQTFCPIHPTF